MSVVSPASSVSVTPPSNSERTNTEMLLCMAEGGPGNTFNWTKLEDPGFSETTANISVMVSDASDGGVYQCTVTNSAGSGMNQTTINGKT